MSNYTQKQVKSIVRRLNKVGQDMEDLGIGLMSGNCNDNGIVVDEETGETLGIIGPFGVWKGGDPSAYIHNGKVYLPDYSPEAGEHWRSLTGKSPYWKSA